MKSFRVINLRRQMSLDRCHLIVFVSCSGRPTTSACSCLQLLRSVSRLELNIISKKTLHACTRVLCVVFYCVHLCITRTCTCDGIFDVFQSDVKQRPCSRVFGIHVSHAQIFGCVFMCYFCGAQHVTSLADSDVIR